jgi:hypothetical protein
MATYAKSTIAEKEELALEKGVSAGPSGLTSRRLVRVLDTQVSLPIGTFPATGTARFGILPKGAQILRRPTEISTTHGSDIPGKLVFTPVDGSTGTQELTGVSAETTTTPAASIPPTATPAPVLEKDCFVEFMPTSDTSIASTVKAMMACIAYSVPH